MTELDIVRRGGGNRLNFTVVDGNSAPPNPKKNTIWVITGTRVSSWIFSAKEPQGNEVGQVWIKTSLASPVEFNALKKNNISVYPAQAYQWNGSAWNAKTARIYQGGAWKDLEVYLYNYDKLGYTWNTVGKIYTSGEGSPNAPTVTTGSGGVLNIRQSNDSSCGIAYISQKIDLTQYKTLTFSGVLSAVSTDLWRARLCIWSNLGDKCEQNMALNKSANVSGTVTIDISALSGSYYIGFSIHDDSSSIDVNYIKLSA